jgi:DHA1 family bicyclomycin/chloramphenicol resistance-like MFS transporter
MDMFLPSLPVIAQAFGAEPGAVQLSVTTYLLGLALGQLTWGPVSDCFGRKPVLIAGLGLFLAASAYGAAADTVQEVVLPTILYLFGCSFMIPSATAAALSPFPQMAGAASSLLGALPFGLGAIVSAALAFAYDGTTRPMALAIAAFGFLAFLSERYFFTKINHG